MTARISNAMTTLTSRLAVSRSGPVALHLACILAGSDGVMHGQGITRELRGQSRSWVEQDRSCTRANSAYARWHAELMASFYGWA